MFFINVRNHRVSHYETLPLSPIGKYSAALKEIFDYYCLINENYSAALKEVFCYQYMINRNYTAALKEIF